ncbi:hypothetical protein BJ508DRAFT_381928 [Ascobolus immersus RN42]|uniref:AA1-like domain-containing protein n=1 Tax=Ascobolus immersus RN42 TaxID=1160509 RepID=A0A3N4HB31_ASCIM|nr:hypothetical protein BJ508DRAFT_381928 [Ascobolus immersus RN42]
MKVSVSFLSALATSLVAGMSIPTPSHGISARQSMPIVYHATFYVDADFQGRSFRTAQVDWTRPNPSATGCQNLASGDNDKVSSIKMSWTVGGWFECKFYKDANCSGDMTRLTYPDEQRNLKYWRDGTFNDKISSYDCYHIAQ